MRLNGRKAEVPPSQRPQPTRFAPRTARAHTGEDPSSPCTIATPSRPVLGMQRRFDSSNAADLLKFRSSFHQTGLLSGGAFSLIVDGVPAIWHNCS